MKPASESDLAEAIAGANGPLRIVGGGTRPIGALIDGEAVMTGGISGVRLYEPGSLTIVVAAGTPVSEVAALLAQNGQCLPFEPMDHRGLLGTEGEPTVGGMAASNTSGPRRVAVGACRDFMLGIRLVDGRGRVVRNGGRVMKNVTGYDLVKLFAGSRGTLGVITEVAFKVLPVAEFRAVLLLEGLSDGVAIAALSDALGSPFGVSGAAHLQRGLDGSPVTMIRVEGFEESVLHRAARLRSLLQNYGDFDVETDQSRTAAGWKWVRDAAAFHGRDGDVWRISAQPSGAANLIDRINRNGDLEAAYDWGGGLIWVLSPEGLDLRERMGAFAGHATLVRASEETLARVPAFHPQPERISRLSEGLRRQFDPDGKLNPGLMG